MVKSLEVVWATVVRIRRPSFLIFALLLLILLHSGCQPQRGVLTLSPEQIELEWKPENDGHQTVNITLGNSGSALLTVKHVSTSCSCTVAKNGTANLKPGEDSQLSLDVHLAKHGDQEVVVTVETDSPVTPTSVLRLKLLGEKKNVPQVWRAVPSTMIAFRTLGETVTSEVEIVTLEYASASPWITGLTADLRESSAKVECRLTDMQEEITGGKGTTVRAYKFEVSATPASAERESLFLSIQTSGVGAGKEQPVLLVLDPAPVIRTLPNSVEAHRQETGFSELLIVFIADDDLPFAPVDEGKLSWCQLLPDVEQPTLSTNTKRMKVRIDWDQCPKELGEKPVFVVKVNHAECDEVRIPILIVE